MKLVIFFKSHWILLLILLMGFTANLYDLDGLPAEMWGDATAHYNLARDVQSGHLFIDYRFGGDGPIFTYLVVLLASIFGLSFYTLKLTSSLIGFCFILSMYFLALEFFHKKNLAYITSFLAAVSFWSLTFMRQPHARILVPLFVALTLLFALKKKNILTGILLGLGMYTQASFWAMPLIFFGQIRILLVGFIFVIPLVMSFVVSPVGFFSDGSYFGEKLAVFSHLNTFEIIKIVSSNFLANLLAYNVNGDRTFRLNVPGDPHLDFISGIFFILGFFLIVYKSIREKNHIFFLYFVLFFFVIQIPSILDIHNPKAQPNIGRMIGVTPIVFMSIVYGIYFSIHRLTLLISDTSVRKITYSVGIFGLLILIAGLNFYKYFFIYPKYLPNHNTPFAKIITTAIDQYEKEANIIVVGSSWGEWGQPEQEAIRSLLNKPHEISFLPSEPKISILCSLVKQNYKTVIVTDPIKIDFTEEIEQCGNIEESKLLHKNGFDVARIIVLHSNNLSY